MQVFKKKFINIDHPVPDSWTIATIKDETKFGIIRFNTGVDPNDFKGKFKFCAIFTIAFNENYDDTLDISYDFEDTFFDKIQSSGDGVIFCIVTNNENRSFFAYTKSQAIGKKIKKKMCRQFAKINIDISTHIDENWDNFIMLKPNSES